MQVGRWGYLLFSYSVAVLIVSILSMGSYFLVMTYEDGQTAMRTYTFRRRQLVARERRTYAGGKTKLNADERVVNELIMAHKFYEREKSRRNASHFDSGQQFVLARCQIARTALHKLFRSMPKGGLLNVYDMGVYSVDYMLTLTYREHLWMCVGPDGGFEVLRFSRQRPHGWHAVPGCEWHLLQEWRQSQGHCNVDACLRRRLQPLAWNMAAIAPRRQYEQVTQFLLGLVSFKPVWMDYSYHVLNELYADGLQYVEFSSSLPQLYDLDDSNYTIMDTVHIMHVASMTFRRHHPDFIGARLIYAPTRNASSCQLEQYLKNALKLKQFFPYYFIGFDLSGPSIGKYRLEEFAHKLVPLRRKLKFYFHAGVVATPDDDLMDAVLLGTKRIINGYNLFKHPEILRHLWTKKIPVVSTPISDQIMQLVLNFRHHPSGFLLANGYRMIIGSDAPSYWQATPLTDDYYVTFLGIAASTADLGMLKHLSMNSLQYSGLDAKSKQLAVRKWLKRWNSWAMDVAKEQQWF